MRNVSRHKGSGTWPITLKLEISTSHQQLTRMGIERGASTKAHRGSGYQSPAVLGVKPAFEDVDAGNFLAFLPASLKTKSCPTSFVTKIT